MTPEARAFFDQLDEIAVKNDQASKEIFAVLTALRSFDFGTLKQVTTIPIRRAALPKATAKTDALRNPNDRIQVGENGFLATILEDSADGGRVDLREFRRDWDDRTPKKQVRAEQHFAGHAIEAANVLGLRVVR